MPVEPTLAMSTEELAQAMVPEDPAATTQPEAETGNRGRRGRLGKDKDDSGKPPKTKGGRNRDAGSSPEPSASRPEKPARGSTTRSARPAIIIIAAVAAVALLVAGGVWLITMQTGAPSGSPTNADDSSALDPLVTADDLGNLGGLTWTASTSRSDEVSLTCMPASAPDLPPAARTVSRQTLSDGSRIDVFNQTVNTYADDAAATKAYEIRLAQAGTCAEGTAWISGADAVAGLADTADAEKLVVQDQSDEFHTLLLSRTGRTVSLVDVSTSQAALKTIDVANVVGKALGRQCGGDLGTCPSTITATPALPPKGVPAGWLVNGDLPRVTPGSGHWKSLKPFTDLNVVGTNCEAVSLRKAPGSKSASQATLILADDPDSPELFGVDMVVYDFADSGDAKKFANSLSTNIKECPSKAPNAAVKSGPSVKGKGAGDVAFTGATFAISQKTDADTMRYRVGVLTLGSKVVYLMNNATETFEFSDSQWKAITTRAGQRASQA